MAQVDAALAEWALDVAQAPWRDGGGSAHA